MNSGSSGIGGMRSTRNAVVTSSGATGAQAAHSRRTSSACRMSHSSIPAYAVSIGYMRNSSAVTTPRLPPPPRTAQKISGLVSASARTRVPSPITTSTAVRLLVARPSLRAYHPMPPPRL